MTKRERMAAYREAARRVAQSKEEIGLYNKRVLPLGFVGILFEAGPLYSPTEMAILNPETRVLALLLAAEMVRTGDL